jgi:hypothetical protein
MREFRMLEFKISSPPWVTLTALLHSHRSCAVHWEVKRTGILTDRWKGCKLEQVQSMLMPGSKVEVAEEDLLHTAHRPGNTEFQEQHFGEQSRKFCFRY